MRCTCRARLKGQHCGLFLFSSLVQNVRIIEAELWVVVRVELAVDVEHDSVILRKTKIRNLR